MIAQGARNRAIAAAMKKPHIKAVFDAIEEAIADGRLNTSELKAPSNLFHNDIFPLFTSLGYSVRFGLQSNPVVFIIWF